jgi:hypothetical protein
LSDHHCRSTLNCLGGNRAGLLAGHLGHRPSSIDHTMSCLRLELQRELPPRSSRIGHPSSRPKVSLSGVHQILGGLIYGNVLRGRGDQVSQLFLRRCTLQAAWGKESAEGKSDNQFRRQLSVGPRQRRRSRGAQKRLWAGKLPRSPRRACRNSRYLCQRNPDTAPFSGQLSIN